MSTVEGFQLPVMPLVELEGRAGTAPPAQITNEVPKLNVGVTLALTVTFMVTGIAH